MVDAMAKKADDEPKPEKSWREAEPTPNERLRAEQLLRRRLQDDPHVLEQQRMLRQLQNDPRTREQQRMLRQLQNDPRTREQQRILQQLKDDPHARLRPLIDPIPVSRPPDRRGRKRKLTDAEITRGIAIVRKAHAEFQEQYPGRKMKQDIAFEALAQELTRDGEPIVIEQKALRRWIVGPALKPK
jgi:hypothetical protein